MNNKGHLISLLLGKVLCMPQDSKSCDVCSCVCIESVHESSSYEKEGKKKQNRKKNDQEKQHFNNTVHSLNEVAYIQFESGWVTV